MLKYERVKGNPNLTEDVLRQLHYGVGRVKDIAGKINSNPRAVSAVLLKLARRGEAVRVGHGRYRVFVDADKYNY
jgi:predicted Rossmann fold nucleotide-binding protein DprA/Smf involved in DNA uptake